MPAAHTHPQRKRFDCRSCGEREPYKFPPTYKTICTTCRNAREAARLRNKSATITPKSGCPHGVADTRPCAAGRSE